MSRSRRRWQMLLVAAGLTLLTTLGLLTVNGLAPMPHRLPPGDGASTHPQVVSRDGVVLRRSYREPWNTHDRVALHQVPPLLRDALIGAEDRRFRHHGGADWRARMAAAWQNLRAGRVVRGASTISEQCVRLLHPRSRSLWSRWLEGFDAARLEARFGKTALLEFYLNQVPYAANRRGVVQAARHYFDRDLDTLSRREMLTLAVLVRAPSRLDPWRKPHAADGAVTRLAAHLRAMGQLETEPFERALELRRPTLALEAPHLVRRALARSTDGDARIHTTIDAATQNTTHALLSRRLDALAASGAAHAAALVVDHRDDTIRAWAAATAAGHPASHVDPVLARRQPGSTLKPFVYALALEKGWTAATRILDAPFAQSVGNGQHAYRNYSRVHYGPVSLRSALGNSLNIPAVKALAFVGGDTLLKRLRALGLTSLERSVAEYGDGLALGNGEVSLLELVTAYAALASNGRMRPLHLLHDEPRDIERPLLDPAVSTLIANILADPQARSLEFSDGGVLELPVQTAVKTGTSSDHHDAWAIGFDHRHVVGVWIGDLSRRPMHRVTGASGPALVLRALFAHLNRDDDTRDLPLDPRLQRHTVCTDDGRPADEECLHRTGEWFIPGHPPSVTPPLPTTSRPRIRQPGPGLRLAVDPRLPDHAQRFRFALAPGSATDTVEWYVNGKLEHISADTDWLWPLRKGEHQVYALVRLSDAAEPERTPSVTFSVR